MQYIKQLDTVRAIAVLLVIIHHWLPPNSFVQVVPNGALGVDIFFVLSGFLITAILLTQRNDAAPVKTVIKHFYFRRALRIFPIYYLTIFLLLLFQHYTNSNIKGSFFYQLTYTANFYFFQSGNWDGLISHLWSLSVEEQFYLVWPWIMLLLPQRFLLAAIGAFIFTGTASQYLMQDVPMHFVLPFTCFDSFGLGALLAWVVQYQPQKLKQFYTRTKIAAIVALVCAILNLYLALPLVPLRTSLSVLALWLISYIVANQHRLQCKIILNNRVLIFLGKISYGLYLYHLIVSQMLQPQLIDKFINPLLPHYVTANHFALLILVENAIVLLLLSWLSYQLIEQRFLNLKRFFSYQSLQQTATPPAQEGKLLVIPSKTKSQP